jgi:hypothetical protein
MPRVPHATTAGRHLNKNITSGAGTRPVPLQFRCVALVQEPATVLVLAEHARVPEIASDSAAAGCHLVALALDCL